MSRHQVRGLPPGVVVVVGFDRALGFWTDTLLPGAHLVYDATTTQDGTTSIAGVLHTLIEAGIFTREDVVDAEMWLAVGDVEDVSEEQAGLRVAAEVLLHLREAAGE